MIRITDAELLILGVMWDSGLPLTQPEILELLNRRGTPLKSIYNTLQRLVRKGLLRDDERVKLGHGKRSRTYTYAMTRDEFSARKVSDGGILEDREMMKIAMHAFDTKGVSDKTLDELQKLIDDFRKELET
jgi:predicted transcriptional regulator